MKSFVVLAIFAILSSAFAVHLSPKQSAFVALKEELKAVKSPMGKTITSLLALQQDITDNSAIIEALNVLRNELSGIADKTKGLYEQATGNHESEAGRLDAYHGALQKTLADNQANLKSNEEDLAITVESIEANEKALSDTINQLEEAAETRAIEHDIFITQTADISASLEALDLAVDLVQQILDQDLESTGFEAFLQTSTNKIKAAMSKVEARLKRSRAGASVAPFLKALAQVMSRGVNQQIAQSILELLRGATEDLNETAHELTKLEGERADAYEELRLQLSDRRDLIIGQINDLRQHQADVEGVIAVLHDNIAQNESDIIDAEEAIQTEADNWAKTDAGYLQRLTRAESDIQLIDKAVVRLA